MSGVMADLRLIFTVCALNTSRCDVIHFDETTVLCKPGSSRGTRWLPIRCIAVKSFLFERVSLLDGVAAALRTARLKCPRF